MFLEMWRGQDMDIYWRDNHIYPSEEEYLEMVKISKDRVRAMIRIYLDLCACNNLERVVCVRMHDVYELILWSSAFRMSSTVMDGIVFVFWEKVFKIISISKLFSVLNTK
jgi:hypothetical protein